MKSLPILRNESQTPFGQKLQPTNESVANGKLGKMLEAIKHQNRPKSGSDDLFK